jgi:hypothetical protein
VNEVKTTKDINVAQIMAEAEIPLAIHIGDDEITIESEASVKEIENLVAAHVPDPDWIAKQLAAFEEAETARALSTERLSATFGTIGKWATEARATYDNWPNLTAAEKDSVVRELVRKFGIALGRFADLVTHARIVP